MVRRNTDCACRCGIDRESVYTDRSGDDRACVIRWTLIAAALGYLGLFLFVPLAAVFTEAMRNGMVTFLESFRDPDAVAAIQLTLLAAGIAVPLNLAFGIAAAWAIAKFEFVGKQVLIALMDVPLAVSPVISGLIYVLLFGLQGWFGPGSNP